MATDPDVLSFPRLNIFGMIRGLLDHNVGFYPISGAPTSGTSGTGVNQLGPGSLVFDYTNGAIYYNNGSITSPTWTAVSLDDVTGDVTISGGVSVIGAGKVRPTMEGLAVINNTGSTIAVDKLVAIVGFDTTSGLPRIVLADADVAAHDNVYITTAAILDGAQGVVYRAALSVANLNTNSASSAGDPVYLSTTAGGFAHTAPSTSISHVIAVGFVVVKSATVGQIYWNITPSSRIIGVNEIQATTLALSVAGVGSSYKLARGIATTASASDTIISGLATVVAVVVAAQDDLDVNLMGVTATIGNQSGAPAAGSFLLKSWKVTTGGASGNPTPVAATSFTKAVNWVAIGT